MSQNENAKHPGPGILAGLLLGLFLGMAGIQAQADNIYRWVDENGVVNYTQQKPRGTEVQTITTRSGGSRVVAESAAAPPPVASNSTGAPLNAEQQKMLEGLQAAERARQEEIAKIKEDNCQQSRDVLAKLTLKNRIRVKDDSGQYRVMDEDDRQGRIARAQENIALYCVSTG